MQVHEDTSEKKKACHLLYIIQIKLHECQLNLTITLKICHLSSYFPLILPLVLLKVVEYSRIYRKLKRKQLRMTNVGSWEVFFTASAQCN